MQTHFDAAQLRDPDVAESERILRQCVHCGFCTATCPTYLLLGDELDGPRGRIYLVKDMLENARPATEEVVRHLDRCLSCLACMTTCPSGVHYQHLIDHARAHVERTYRRPWRERLTRTLLARIIPYPRRLRAAIAVGRLARAILGMLPDRLRTVAGRLPASWRSLLSLAAYRTPRRARSRAAATAPSASASRQGRVALLAGCAQSVLAPNVQAACVRLIERAGAEVVVIEGCCGALVHHLGRSGQNHSLGSSLLDRLRAESARGGLDAVIATASGCGTHLKDYGHLFREDTRLAEAGAWAASLTRDIAEWLYERGVPASNGAPGPAAGVCVAYHSACSMQHGQRLDLIPRRLLERAGFVVEDIPEGHLCCGSAGTYNILQPELAGRLRDRKLDNIRRTSARVVATGNIGCMAQLAVAPDLTFVHTAELLDWAAGGPAPFTRDARTGSTRDRP